MNSHSFATGENPKNLSKYVFVLLTCLIGISLAIVFGLTARANSLKPGVPYYQTLLSGGFPSITDTVSVTLTPGISSSLVYTDAQGLPIILEFPPDAVTKTVTVTLIPDLLTSLPPNAIYGNKAFELLATRVGDLEKNFRFSAPVTTTMQYSDDDVQLIAEEESLHLYWWSGIGWWKAEQTCEPNSPFVHNETDNTIVTAICFPVQYALFATHSIYVPLLVR